MPGQRSDHVHFLDWPTAMTDLWPADWPRFPLARIITCGSPLSIEVLQGWENGQPCYAPPDAVLWKQHASKSVLALLALLTSQSGYLVSQDFLTQTLRPGQQSKDTFDDEENEEQADRALKRPENLVTALRHLLYPPALLHLPESSQRVIRNLLIRRIKASHDSGPAYQLSTQSLLWLDVEAMESYAKQAATLEQFGEPAWDAWKALTDIGFRGTFLPHEPYSDWTLWRRARVRELLWQGVEAQLKAIGQWEDQERGEDVAIRLLSAHWQAEPTNEDAFRALAEKLGKRERFQQAEDLYQQLCLVLESEGREPHERTNDIMEFVRTKKMQRTPRTQPEQMLSSWQKRSMPWAGDLGFLASRTPSSTLTQSDLVFPRATGLEGGGFPGIWNTSPWSVSPAETLERLSRALAKPVQLDDRALLALETVVRDCWRFRPDILGEVNPHLLQVVLGHLQQIAVFLSGSLLPSTRMRLCALTSELTQIAGWTLYEMRAFSQAQAYYRMAMRAAHEAEHPALEAIALARMSRTFKYCAQEESVLPSLQYARHLLNDQQKSPVYSWLCAEEALAYAREGGTYESLKMLECVTEVFQPERQEDDPYWVGFEANVKAGFFGSCYIALRQPEHAEVWYREALAQIHGSTRINPNHRRSLLSINLATILVEQGALEDACLLAGEALHMLTQSKAPLVLQHLIKFRRTLKPWKSQAVVETFETTFLHIQSSFFQNEATIL